MNRTHWAIKWRSSSLLDGKQEHLICAPELGLPLLFRTRKDARWYREAVYGYIRERIDLQSEPHGWRMPTVVAVNVNVKVKVTP